MSSRAEVRRGRNNSRNETKGSWKAPSTVAARSQTPHRDRSASREETYIEGSIVTRGEVSVTDKIDLDALKAENESGKWVEYKPLYERLGDIKKDDPAFVLKFIIAFSLILFIIAMASQCIMMKLSYDRINERISHLQARLDEMEITGAYESQAEGETVLSDEVSETDAEQEAPAALVPDKKKIYLTFDDGPSSRTSEILDILKEYDAKATFFVCGREGYEDVLRRIVDEGHTIAMHSYSHDYDSLYESLDSFQADMHKLQNYIYDVTGVWTKYYRFPGGSSNTRSNVDMKELEDYLDRDGIVYFDWNVYSGDKVSSDIMVSNVIAGIDEYDTCMILMHDASDKAAVTQALPKILEYIQDLPDTELVPVTEDTVPVQHSSNLSHE
ncbi:polysaccharide deacetylase family protein [Butyrivibrio sp. MC2013]|uniref:polysaccharide deacetylase family protein n=1 Tax=Butyrivibrio sp. MC2013 TaxID=1280686 RepID=UPI0004035BB3|nr:polysaccharide deacetylase family protein [Butyrivibrio sp. MC2013]